MGESRTSASTAAYSRRTQVVVRIRVARARATDVPTPGFNSGSVTYSKLLRVPVDGLGSTVVDGINGLSALHVGVILVTRFVPPATESAVAVDIQ